MTKTTDNRPLIIIEQRSAYGQERIYPIGANAKAVQRLTGKKTLTWGDCEALQDLGCRIEDKQVYEQNLRDEALRLSDRKRFQCPDDLDGDCDRCGQEDAGEVEDLEGNRLCDACGEDFIREYNAEYC